MEDAVVIREARVLCTLPLSLTCIARLDRPQGHSRQTTVVQRSTATDSLLGPIRVFRKTDGRHMSLDGCICRSWFRGPCLSMHSLLRKLVMVQSHESW